MLTTNLTFLKLNIALREFVGNLVILNKMMWTVHILNSLSRDILIGVKELWATRLGVLLAGNSLNHESVKIGFSLFVPLYIIY